MLRETVFALLLGAAAACGRPPESFAFRPLSEQEASRFFPLGHEGHRYDPYTYFGWVPDLDTRQKMRDGSWKPYVIRTNSMGLRRDSDVMGEPPDLLVIVSGDGQIAAPMPNRMTLPQRLEGLLGRRFPGQVVEVWNASCGSYSFHNHLGVLHKFASFEPEVFVLAVYGGNDFEEVTTLYHYFLGTEKPNRSNYLGPMQAAQAIDTPSLSQFLIAAKFFQFHPAQRDVALRAAIGITDEIDAVCRRRGARLLVLYVPSPAEVATRAVKPFLDRSLEALELTRADLELLGRMADTYLAAVSERGIPVVDLREVLIEEEQDLFLRGDLHLSPEAHRLGARALAAPLERLVGVRDS